MSVLNKLTKEFKKKLKKTLWRKIECEPDYDGRMVFFTGIARRQYIDIFYIAKSAIYYQFSKRMREYGVGNLTMWIGLANINLNRTGMYWLHVRPENEKYLVTYYQKIEFLYLNDGAFQPNAYYDDCLCPCIEFGGRYEDLAGYPEDEEHEQEMIDDYNQQDEKHAARLRQVLENLKKQKTSKKTFYEEKCVICLEEKPDILFCNCGHIPICAKCDDLNENSNKCPICKTDSDIKRKL